MERPSYIYIFLLILGYIKLAEIIAILILGTTAGILANLIALLITVILVFILYDSARKD